MLRFAPSPTGDMHIGNLRAAIFNHIMAKKLKERFIVRIEDTDIQRNIENKDKDILEILQIFGLEYDEVIYQSDNFAKHRDIALKLLKEGRAFYCFCSKEFLEEKKQIAISKKIPFRYEDSWANLEKGNRQESDIIRLKGASNNISFKDCIMGDISFNAKEIDSFIIMRNYVPTYNFACSIDDEYMSLIIRGQDHISNTPRQILIRQALGFSNNVSYAHLPIILSENNKKMSKRDSVSSVKWLLDSGLDPKAIANYLILLGNSKLESIIGDCFSIQDCIANFDISNVSKNSPIFDYKKLAHINRSMLRKKSLDSFYTPLQSHLQDQGITDIRIDNNSNVLIEIYLQESANLQELKEHIAKIFARIKDKRQIANEFKDSVDLLLDSMLKITSFPVDYESFKDALMQDSGLKGKNFFKPLRIIFSASTSGIELDKLYSAIRVYLYTIIRR